MKARPKPNAEKAFKVYPRGRAWYVDFEGETYSFMSEQEAHRFCARTRNLTKPIKFRW